MILSNILSAVNANAMNSDFNEQHYLSRCYEKKKQECSFPENIISKKNCVEQLIEKSNKSVTPKESIIFEIKTDVIDSENNIIMLNFLKNDTPPKNNIKNISKPIEGLGL